MKPFSISLFLSYAGAWARAFPVARQSKSPYFFLIGDSTVAQGGGWGDSLLDYLKEPAQGENWAESGTTTVSWKANGRWDDLLESIDANKNYYEPIVTVQFGHNDQKSLELSEFKANLESIASDIEEAGGTPVCNSKGIFWSQIYVLSCQRSSLHL